jgi:hypothetical protein
MTSACAASSTPVQYNIRSSGGCIVRRLKSLAVAAAAAVCLTTGIPFAARGADLTVGDHHILSLTGEIKRGDAERMASLVARDSWILSLDINSPGGDLVESMRIGDLVRGLHLPVYVVKEGYCVSACFIVLIEAQHRVFSAALDDGTLPSQDLRERWFGFVGIHRPVFAVRGDDTVDTDRQEDMMRNVRTYLAAKSVPHHLIDEMMARPSNDVYWLRDDDARLIGEYDPGDQEALIARCGYKPVRQMYIEGWSEKRQQRLAECVTEFRMERYRPLQEQFIAKLRTGWRPWKH